MSSSVTSELVRRSLFLEPSPDRLAALLRAATEVQSWEGLVETLEAHGVLVLARRNFQLAQARLPEEISVQLGRREEALREDALRMRLTTQRFLAAASARRIEVTLLKGCSLALDLYPDAALRGQGDVDLHVRREELRSALEAGAEVGLLPSARSLPRWWYALSHFHLKLAPTSALLREVEVHWDLHHPSLLLTVRAEDWMARRLPVELEGHSALTLDPLDRLLHLITHLESHAGGVSTPPDRASLLRVAAERTHPIRLKWLLDIHAEIERRREAMGPDLFVRRTQEWNATQQVRWALTWIRAGLGLSPPADKWAAEVLAQLPSRGQAAFAPGVAHRREPAPLASLDFRASSVRRLGPWLWPPQSYLRKRYPDRPLALSRARHALLVLARGIVSLCALPLAHASRLLVEPARKRARAEASSPERVLELAGAWRALTRDAAGSARLDGGA